MVNGPVVALTEPAEGAVFNAGETVQLAAYASDYNGSVASVEFFVDSQSVDVDTTSPFTGVWAASINGTHVVSAQATDSHGFTQVSEVVRIVVVGQPGAPPDPPPPAGIGGAASTIAGTIQYYHSDAIGSVRMITDATGGVVARYDYLPFGEEWGSPTVQDPRKFGGKERDTETTFDYFGARYFSASMGRFTTVDPISVNELAVCESTALESLHVRHQQRTHIW